ncbi:MAG: FHA domain-containing protein [Deltaproteobacteria bacterium]|nr:FHA domain-containing protein [Deltaproteobacteria bacterium]
MPKEITAEAVEYPINEALLKEATELKEKWRVLKERLEKIDDNRSQVSPAVYDRVRKDYEARLNESRGRLLEKKAEVDRELALLRTTQKKVSARFEEHQHLLEEIKFRYSLGEFDEQDYRERSTEAAEKLGKFETILSAITANIERYESIFATETDLAAPVSSREPRKTESGAAKSAGAAILTENLDEDSEPETDESGYIIEEEKRDYFTDTGATSSQVDISGTVKTKPAARGAVSGARLVIVKGPHAGATYAITDVLSMGRADSNTIVVRDGKASRQHCKIERKGNDYFLLDLNSSNGTTVNGERVEEHILVNNDKVQIGDCVLQFQR